MSEVQSLGKLLPQEQARCRELLVEYKKIGPGGMFASALIEDALKRTDQAVIQGDLPAMIRCYMELKEFK